MAAAPPTALPPAPPAPRYAKGSKVEYRDVSGVRVAATVDTAAVDDALEPYYEIALAGGGDKSTVEARLRPTADTRIIAAAAAAAAEDPLGPLADDLLPGCTRHSSTGRGRVATKQAAYPKLFKARLSHHSAARVG